MGRLPRHLQDCVLARETADDCRRAEFAKNSSPSHCLPPIYQAVSTPAFLGALFALMAGMVLYLVLVHVLPASYNYDPYSGKWVGLWGLIGVLVIRIILSV